MSARLPDSCAKYGPITLQSTCSESSTSAHEKSISGSSSWLRSISGYATVSRISSMMSLFSCQTYRRGSLLHASQQYFNLGTARRHSDFVVEGRRKWQECAVYQQRLINCGDFIRILVYGLPNLDRLNSVHICRE